MFELFLGSKQVKNDADYKQNIHAYVTLLFKTTTQVIMVPYILVWENLVLDSEYCPLGGIFTIPTEYNYIMNDSVIPAFIYGSVSKCLI